MFRYCLGARGMDSRHSGLSETHVTYGHGISCTIGECSHSTRNIGPFSISRSVPLSFESGRLTKFQSTWFTWPGLGRHGLSRIHYSDYLEHALTIYSIWLRKDARKVPTYWPVLPRLGS